MRTNNASCLRTTGGRFASASAIDASMARHAGSSSADGVRDHRYGESTKGRPEEAGSAVSTAAKVVSWRPALQPHTWPPRSSWDADFADWLIVRIASWRNDPPLHKQKQLLLVRRRVRGTRNDPPNPLESAKSASHFELDGSLRRQAQ